MYLNFYFSYPENKRAEKLSLSNDFEEIKSFIEKIGTNRQLLDRKLHFDFKKPSSFLIPKYIFAISWRNATPKNSISPKFTSSIDKNCRLQSPINTSVDKNSIFSVVGKIPPDFLSKNRLNRQEMLIENNRNCRLRESLFAGKNIHKQDACVTLNKKWSGRLDLNQRPLDPQSSALPGYATPRILFEDLLISINHSIIKSLNKKWLARQDLNLDYLVPETSVLPITPRANKNIFL